VACALPFPRVFSSPMFFWKERSFPFFAPRRTGSVLPAKKVNSASRTFCFVVSVNIPFFWARPLPWPWRSHSLFRPQVTVTFSMVKKSSALGKVVAPFSKNGCPRAEKEIGLSSPPTLKMIFYNDARPFRWTTFALHPKIYNPGCSLPPHSVSFSSRTTRGLPSD